MSNLNVNRKNLMGWIFTSLLLALTLFTSCENGLTWNEPVRDYLDKYSNTAAIEKHEISCEYLKDSSDEICIPSDGAKTVTFYLRNPRQYTLNPITFSISDGGITVEQDTSDRTVIRVTYSESYLEAHDGGESIGGTIGLTESETLREFDPYTFNLKCNTPPPGVKGGMVNKADGKYWVCFYLPKGILANSIHNKETHTLYIDGQEIASGDADALYNESLSRPDLLPLEEGGVVFSATAPSNYSPFYWETDHDPIGDASWKVKLVDEHGLSSYEAIVSTRTTAQPLTLSGDSTIVKGNQAVITAALPVGVTATSYDVQSSEGIVTTSAQPNGTITVNPTGTGTTTLTVTANLPGGQISQATKTIRVIDLTLSDASEEVMFVAGDDVTLSATPAGFPSTPTCTWTSSDGTVATVNSSGKISAVNPGTATITASATYDGKIATATKTVNVYKVSLAGESVSLVGATNTIAMTASVEEPTGSSASIGYTWISTAPTVASVTMDSTDNTKATVTPSATTSGTTDIKVTVSIGTKYFTAEKTVTIYDLKITGNPLINASGSGGAFTVYANAGSSDYNPPTGMNITWSKGSSTNVTLATSNSGKTCTLTPQNAGSFNLQVTASLSGGKSLTKTKKIYVISVSGDTDFIEGETPRSLTVTPNTSELAYTWQSTNANIATVNSSGNITAKADGNPNIKLTVKLGTEYSTVITTPISVYGVTISGNPLLKEGGSSTTLTAEVKNGSNNYPETLTYEWTSGSASIATANTSTGTIAPVKGGTSEITLTVKKSGTTVATKKQKVYVIAVSGLTDFIVDETARKLSETPSKSQATELTYTWGSNSSNASIDSSTGYITANTKGSATISLTVTKGSYSVSVPTDITIHKLTLTGLPTEIAVDESYETEYSFDPTLSYNTLTCEPNSGNYNTVTRTMKDGSKIVFGGKATGTETFTLKLTKNGTTIQYELPTITVVSAHEVSINNLSTWLSNQPDTTTSKPYKIKVTGLNSSNLSTLHDALNVVDITGNRKYVDLSSTNLPNVTNMDECFKQCYLLVSPPAIPTTVTSMEQCFAGCTNLKTAPTIPNGVTNLNLCFASTYIEAAPNIPSSVTNMEGCFGNCYKLKTPPSSIPSGVTSLNATFSGCSALESAPVIPANVTNMMNCFKDCTSLSGDVTAKCNISDGRYWGKAFENCNNVNKVYVKSSNIISKMKFDGGAYDVGLPKSKFAVAP